MPCPVAVLCGMCLPLPGSLWVSLCFVGSSELRLLKTQINSTALLLSCSPCMPWVLLSLAGQAGSDGGYSLVILPLIMLQEGFSRIPSVPLLGLCSAPWERALCCVVFQAPLKFQGHMQENVFVTERLLVPSHAGFVKLCSW